MRDEQSGDELQTIISVCDEFADYVKNRTNQPTLLDEAEIEGVDQLTI